MQDLTHSDDLDSSNQDLLRWLADSAGVFSVKSAIKRRPYLAIVSWHYLGWPKSCIPAHCSLCWSFIGINWVLKVG